MSEYMLRKQLEFKNCIILFVMVVKCVSDLIKC